ncbi:hypothetical protein MMC18_002757 [Xylographa bjoerkii]|nr:hypothetical protein [Xylographa bjoerkii]
MAPIKKSKSRKRYRTGRQHSWIAALITSNIKNVNKRLDKIIELLEVTVSVAAPKNVITAATPLTSRIAKVDWDKIKAKTTPSLPPSEVAFPEAHSQHQSCFMRLPQEIRSQIYELVLVSARPITEPHNLMSENRDDATPRIEDINSSLVMTCRRVCAEAVPVLYGTLNTFQFSNPLYIKFFNFEGRHHANFIRRIRFAFDRPLSKDFKGRAAAAKRWVDQLFPVCIDSTMSLPGLRELELDLTSWGMRTADTCPPSLIKGLKNRGWKVQKLELRGLENQPVLRELLEQTLLETPPARVLTNEDGQVLEAIGSSCAVGKPFRA